MTVGPPIARDALARFAPQAGGAVLMTVPAANLPHDEPKAIDL